MGVQRGGVSRVYILQVSISRAGDLRGLEGGLRASVVVHSWHFVGCLFSG